MNNITTHTTITSRRRLIAIAAILTVGTAAPAQVASAADAPKPGTTDSGLQLSDVDRGRMERQKPLIAAADIIRAAVDKDAEADPRSGYSSIALGESSVVLRWKGALPGAVEAAVERARRDVAVEVVGARRTDAEMQAKVAQVRQVIEKLAGGAPFAVSMTIQGDRVRVEVEDDVVARIKSGLPALDLPIEVTAGDVPEPAGRANDTPEFYGGGQIRFPMGNGNWGLCTAGFAVRKWTGNWTASEYLVTAGHCGHPGIWFYNGDFSRWIGSAGAEDIYNDLLLVPTENLFPGPGQVFNNRAGQPDTSGVVDGWHQPYHGEYLCTSGSLTGRVCDVRVDTSTAYSYCGYNAWRIWECYGGMYRAWQSAGLRVTQPGDSGGPVYNYNMSATGIISGGNSAGDMVVFQDFHTIWKLWGVFPK